jgi:copper chaperone
MKMQKATIQLEPLACPSCMQKIENAVKTVDGIDEGSLSVLFNASKVKVNFDEEKTSIEDIENAITKMGYEVKKSTVRNA